MLWIATAAALASTSPNTEAIVRDVPRRQAHAVARILKAATVRLGKDSGRPDEGRSLLTSRSMRVEDGLTQRVVLVEFY